MIMDEYTRSMVAKKCAHEVHTSERKSFRGCRRRWNWVFRENYYPPLTPRPLEFGVAYHKAMEVLHCPTTWRYNHMALGALAEKAFVENCEQQRAAYLRAREMYCLEGEEAEDYDERLKLGRGMIWYYVKKHLPKLQAKYTPTHVEVSFDVPLQDENGRQMFCKCKACRRVYAKAGGGNWRGNPVTLSGRVDAIFHDTEGGYWIFDWKTAANIRDDTDDFLDLDDQILSYLLALRKLMGLNIRGFVYFEIRKAYPEPPKENKHVRLGRKFSVNAQQSTNYEIYKQTVERYDADAYKDGFYNEFLEWLQTYGPTFYAEHPVYKTDYQLNEAERNLILEVKDMLEPNLRIYPTPGRFACLTCAFRQPCLSLNAGHDYRYTLETLFEKREPYYRLRQGLASTDTRGAQ